MMLNWMYYISDFVLVMGISSVIHSHSLQQISLFLDCKLWWKTDV